MMELSVLPSGMISGHINPNIPTETLVERQKQASAITKVYCPFLINMAGFVMCNHMEEGCLSWHPMSSLKPGFIVH